MGFKTINGKRVNVSIHSGSGEIQQKPKDPMTQAELYRDKIRRIKEIEEQN